MTTQRDNYEPICWFRFSIFFSLFFSFHQQKPQKLIFLSFFFCHKTRQLIVKLFKIFRLWIFTRAHEKPPDSTSTRWMKMLRLSQRSYGKTENKNREKRAKSESTEISTLTQSARCRSNEIFSTVFVGVKRFSFNNDRFGENISFSRCNIKWIYDSQRVGEGHLCESIVSLRQTFPFVYTCFPSNMSQFSFCVDF